MTGKRVEFLYVRTRGQESKLASSLSRIREYAAQVDAAYHQSATKTGGTRHVRFVTNPPAGGVCEVVVTEVVVPDEVFTDAIAMARPGAAVRDALQQLGYARPDRKYIALLADPKIFTVASVLGITYPLAEDSSSWDSWTEPGLENPFNHRTTYVLVPAEGAGFNPQVITHELTHALGAVMPGAPHYAAFGGGHCTDGYDVMCDPSCPDPNDTANPSCRAGGSPPCPQSHKPLLDCNNDDYFHTNPLPGNWLATHWNVADSEFLIKDAAATPSSPQTSPAVPALPASPAVPVRPASPAVSTPLGRMGCQGPRPPMALRP